MSSNANEGNPTNVVEPQTVEDSIEEPLIPIGSVITSEPEPGKTFVFKLKLIYFSSDFTISSLF